MRRMSLALVAFALGIYGSMANAIVVTIADNLTLATEAAPGIQQAAQGPCVIGDPSCNSNTGTYISTFTTLPNGNPSSYDDILSPVYSVADFRLDAGDIFDIGIDINATGNNLSDHSLTTFVALIDGVQTYAYTGGEVLTSILNNPGNGFSDWRLSGFDLTGLAGTSTIQFGVDMGDTDAGRDQFFVIAGAPPVQSVYEPATLGLFGIGLLALGMRRKISR